MEKKRMSNFEILTLSLVICFIIIIIGSIGKIVEVHNEKLLYAMHTKVEYYAKRCYLENMCTESMTLKELYDKEYITDEVVNPVTKEIIDENLEINYIDGEIKIDWD